MKKINKILLELYNDRKQLLVLSFLSYISMLTEDLMPSDPNVMQATALIAGVAVAAIGVGVTMYNNKKNRDAAEEAATKADAKQKIEDAKLAEQKEQYKDMKFENPYENMENTMEDLTVNQQQAQFQAKEGSQQRANIMQNMKGAAGASGIAALAQSLANKGQLQTQQISASIGQQESANQRLSAGQAAKNQGAEIGGEQWVQQQGINRENTLLGMQMGSSAAANAGMQQAEQNQQAVEMKAQADMSSSISSMGSAVGAYGAGASSKKSGGGSTTYIGDIDPNMTQKTGGMNDVYIP